MANDEPDWNLLPEEPEDFFGLSEGWDRRALKRSYNRLIKVYRPEREPERFRDIRAAYENLLDMLEWRERFAAQSNDGDVVEPTMPIERVHDFDSVDLGPAAPVPSQPQPAKDEVEIRVPLDDSEEVEMQYANYGVSWGRARSQALSLIEDGATHRQVLEKLATEPPQMQDEENLWLRAMLADLDDPTGRQFFEALLDGIAQKPDANLLLETFYAYLKDRDDEQDPAELLEMARRRLPETLHYSMLKPLWLELLDKQPENCWKRLDDIEPSFHLQGSFYDLLMTIAGCRALAMPLPRYLLLMERLDSHHDQINYFEQEHLDYLLALAHYREVREKHPPESEGMLLLEEAIKEHAATFGPFEVKAREIIIKLSRQANRDWFDQQFPVGHPLLAPASELALHITHRLGLGNANAMDDYERPDVLHQRLDRHLQAAYKLTNDKPGGFGVWMTILGRLIYKGFVNIGAPILLCVLISKVAPTFFDNWSVLIVILSLLAFILGYKFWLHQYEWRIGQKAVLERDRGYYWQYWRAYLLDYIDRNNTSSQIVLNLLRYNGQPDSPSCFEFASEDSGIALYSSLVNIRNHND